MNEYLAKKTPGFYLTVAAAILSAASMIFYRSAESQASVVFQLISISVAVVILMILLTAAMGNKKILELASTICAVLLSAAVILSVIPQVDNLGYLVAGLYSFDDMKSFILYAALSITALICYIAASFMDQSK